MSDHIPTGSPARPTLASRLKARLKRAVTREDGSASLDFVMVIPVLLMVFMASFESGLLVVRHIMLEQAVDKTVRNLRLGLYQIPSAALIKSEICSKTSILKNCEDNIHVELVPISTTTWTMPSGNTECIDRSEDVRPSLKFSPGNANEVMLVRVCVIQDAMFPTSGIGLALPKDGQGGYGLTVIAAFVNEP